MATDRAVSFLDLLRESSLLEPAQLDELSTPDAHNTDPELLCQCIIELGWLSRYQLDHLRQARSQDLKLGSYQLLDRFGVGDTGPAYKARRPGKKGVVALKIIRKNRLAGPDAVARFQQDIRTGAQLQHAHIAPVVTVGQLGNLYLVAREYVEGTDLGRRVRESGPLSAARACDALRQAAQALQHAHEKGLLHRRVKASNLIAGAEVEGKVPVKLVDFGLGQLSNGPLAPASKPVDPRPDLQDLGRTFYYLLTGQLSGALDGVRAAAAVAAQRPNVPAGALTVLARLLGPADGYASAAEVASALEPFCHEAPPAPQEANGSAPVGLGVVPPAPIPLAMPLAEAVAVPAVAVSIGPVPAATPDVAPSEPVNLPFAMPMVQALAVTAAVETVGLVAPPAPSPEPLEGVAIPVLATAMAVEPADVAVEVPMASALAGAAAPEPVVVQAPPPVVEPQPIEVPMASALVMAVGVTEEVPLPPPAPPPPAPAPSEAAPAIAEADPVVPPPLPEAPAPSPTNDLPLPDLVAASPAPAPAAPPLTDASAAPPPPPSLEIAPAPGKTAPLLSEAPAPPPLPPAAPPPLPSAPPSVTPFLPIPETVASSTAVEPADSSMAPPPFFTDAGAQESITFPIGPATSGAPAGYRRQRKKMSRSTVMWLIVGGLLHLAAAAILVIAIMAMFSDKPEPTKSGPRKAPAVRTRPEQPTRSRPPTRPPVTLKTVSDTIDD
jgi:hypothetical protein